MKTRHRIILLGLGLILVAVVVVRMMAADRSAGTRPVMATLVRVGSPLRETVVHTIQSTGDVTAIQQAQIFSKVYGTLEKVYVDIGAQVHAGQLLALIDTTELSFQYQQTSATYENAKRKHDRARELAEKNLAAKQDLDNVEADLRIAQAAWENARTRLDFASITAPFAGYITRRYLDAGAVLISTNATLFTLMDLSQVKITVHVLERDVPLVRTGMKADITVDALPGQTFTGTITRLAQALDPATRTMAVAIDIPNPDLVLKPGMFATVSLTAEERLDALTIPTSALLRDDSGHFIYVADGEIGRRRNVSIGAEQQSRTEILTGLTGDESIIIAGQQLVKDGGAITVQP